jgi:hypothetical protein
VRLRVRGAGVAGAMAAALAAAVACDGGATLLELRVAEPPAPADSAVGTYGLVSVDSAPLPITTTAVVSDTTITAVLLADTLVLAADGQYRETVVTRETRLPARGLPTTATGTAQAQGRWTRADSIVTLFAPPTSAVPQVAALGPLTAAGQLTLRRGPSVRVYQAVRPVAARAPRMAPS